MTRQEAEPTLRMRRWGCILVQAAEYDNRPCAAAMRPYVKLL